jgi:hypothetical protein
MAATRRTSVGSLIVRSIDPWHSLEAILASKLTLTDDTLPVQYDTHTRKS